MISLGKWKIYDKEGNVIGRPTFPVLELKEGEDSISFESNSIFNENSFRINSLKVKKPEIEIEGCIVLIRTTLISPGIYEHFFVVSGKNVVAVNKIIGIISNKISDPKFRLKSLLKTE